MNSPGNSNKSNTFINILIIILTIVIIVLLIVSFYESHNKNNVKCTQCNGNCSGNLSGNVSCYKFKYHEGNLHNHPISDMVICTKDKRMKKKIFKKIEKNKYPDITDLDCSIRHTTKPTSDYDEKCKYDSHNFYVYFPII